MLLNKIFIILLIIIPFKLSCQGQGLNVSNHSCHDIIIGSKKYQSCEIEITNTNKEAIVFWFQKGGHKMNEKERIYNFFYKTKYDFNLYALITDNLVKKEETLLFETFIKKLEPQKSFRIEVIGTSLNDKSCRDFLNKNLSVVGKKTLDDYLKIKDQDYPWYNKDYINILFDYLLKEK